MFQPKSVHATVPVTDYEAAKAWYRDRLGLEPYREAWDGAWYRVGASHLLLYPSGFAGTNQATTAEFDVEDVPAVVAALRERGVVFEEYDLPSLRTDDGVLDVDGQRSAWFKDPDGNILALTELPEP